MSSGKFVILSIAIVFCLLPHSTVYAEGELSIKPGYYKLIKTTKTNFDIVAATSTTEECITDPDLDPESVLPNKENCRIRNLKSTKNNASFDFTCDKTGDKSALKGHANYSTGGNTISYQFKIEGLFRGKALIVESSGTGERIGDCVSEPGLNQ